MFESQGGNTDVEVTTHNSNLFEGPKCKKCGNAADELIRGVWFCENCAPATPLFVPRIVN